MTQKGLLKNLNQKIYIIYNKLKVAKMICMFSHTLPILCAYKILDGYIKIS